MFKKIHISTSIARNLIPPGSAGQSVYDLDFFVVLQWWPVNAEMFGCRFGLLAQKWDWVKELAVNLLILFENM